MREKELFYNMNDEIHAPEALYKKVIDLFGSEKKYHRSAWSKISISAAILALVLLASNGISYASTGKSLLYKVVEYFEDGTVKFRELEKSEKEYRKYVEEKAKSFEKYNAMKTPLNEFEIGILPDEQVDFDIEKMTNTFPLKESNIILSVTCKSKFTYGYDFLSQEVVVDKVFQGDGIKKGDRIETVRAGSGAWVEGMDELEEKKERNIQAETSMFAQIGFVNEMKPEHSYLMFLDRKIENTELYVDSGEYFIHPIFSYEKIKNIPCKNIYAKTNNQHEESMDGTYYKNYPGNEFFVESETSIKKLEKLKKELLKQYPLNG